MKSEKQPELDVMEEVIDALDFLEEHRLNTASDIAHWVSAIRIHSWSEQGAELEYRPPLFTSTQCRRVLIEAESLGIVYRTGKTKSTRWWLG